ILGAPSTVTAHSRPRARSNRTRPFVFTWSGSSTPGSCTFVVDVSGAADAPRVALSDPAAAPAGAGPAATGAKPTDARPGSPYGPTTSRALLLARLTPALQSAKGWRRAAGGPRA